MPFPRIQVTRILQNPVNPDYFYLFKTQAINKEFRIRNYVLSEDLLKFQVQIDKLKNEIIEVEDEDSENDEAEQIHDRDYFEEALEKLRQDKDYNVGKQSL